ncbi:molybdate ABC transporter substrate-binding protein [Desulfofundulus sp. TPOSR]|nr:molybdate ABC transporter substrate-binding protein [Desulfofundulus sp. TPOSR]
MNGGRIKVKKPGGILLLVAGLLIGVVSGCGTPGAEQKTSPAPELMVFAGAGLKDALPEVANLYLQSHPGIKISFNFAGSGTLQKQIEQGAPADIVIFPGEKQMDTLEKESLIDKATRRKILADKLVIITPKESGKVKDFAGLASPGVGKVSIGDPAIVPAGEWAKETLVNLGLWDKVNVKLVLAKDVQQVKTYVETGNVDAGLVWRSTAATSSKIRIAAEAPEEACRPVFFTGAVAGNSKEKETALDFLNYLAGPEAAGVFARYGFTPLSDVQ